MGEVYRVEDLKLGQTVALKFLPQSLARNEEALARFVREVRIARQVSHPNVCRVFDIGEADGQTFLTMEFVDGEDMASLVRRIGRLPADKALEIARQICAGLAAAHEHGIIHRDLKPANIMLDGRGRARITDFGLAGLATEMHREDVRAGTPAYMSPEQFSGGELTPKSDLYALGLVMYEIFTGKKPFDATSYDEMARLREKSAPTAPSTHLKDIDPQVERVMLRCLEKNPDKRPASALQVAAALPGGDPLAAALAAGETPSPELVAASDEREGLRPAIAWGCLLLIVLGLMLNALLAQKTQVATLVPLPNPPEALAVKARDLIRELGYTTTPADTAYSFEGLPEYVDYVDRNDHSLSRWKNLPSGVPPSVGFWYRESPQFLSPQPLSLSVKPSDPPNSISDMRELLLDPQGRLLEFEAVPPQVDTSSDPGSVPNWSALFAAAGMDLNRFKTVPPQWTPLVTSDARTAWEGNWPGRPELPLRVEAAAYRGKPVYFRLVSPWTKPDRMQEQKESRADAIVIAVSCLVILLGVVMARSNVRAGRSDRRGAARVALLAFVCLWFAYFLGAHHVPAASEFLIFFSATLYGLFVGASSWLLYVALEPYIRKRWPHSLISWTRLLTGQIRDPAVGCDLLVGILAAVFWATASRLADLAHGWMGKAPSAPNISLAYDTLSGLRAMVSVLLLNGGGFVFLALAYFFIFFLLRLILRTQWLAVLVTLLLVSIPPLFQELPALHVAEQLFYWGILLLLLIRFGLLALMVALCTFSVLFAYPLTVHLSQWYAGPTFLSVFLILGAAVFGFYTSTRGKPLFGGISLDT